MKMTTEKQARELAKEFVRELEKEFKIRLLYWFVGSVPEGKYQEGKSDIDIVIVPDESCDYGKLAVRMLEKRNEEKYPKILKKGRMTSIIDPVIFFDMNMVQKLREEYHNKINNGVDEQ